MTHGCHLDKLSIDLPHVVRFRVHILGAPNAHSTQDGHGNIQSALSQALVFGLGFLKESLDV
jgi:hypothetical protein